MPFVRHEGFADQVELLALRAEHRRDVAEHLLAEPASLRPPDYRVGGQVYSNSRVAGRRVAVMLSLVVVISMNPPRRRGLVLAETLELSVKFRS